MEVVVYVATHRSYDMPTDPSYRPIHVGRAGATIALPYVGDDTGDNISLSNPTYCELTALYWMWKNTAHDAYGLVHYRRHFAGSGEKGIATGRELRAWLAKYDVVVARRRNYVIETVSSHYARAHHASDLDAARAAVAAISPEFTPAFDTVMRRRTLSLYNIFLMRRDLLKDYCGWLFPILRECEARIPVNTYGPQQARVFGYLGERLFNVWLEHHAVDLRVHRQRVANLEGENYLNKAGGLISRRFGRGRAA